MPPIASNNPTAAVDLSFGHYLAERKAALGRHMIHGVPDYAFSLDRKMRRHLNSVPPLRWAARVLTSFAVPLLKQTMHVEAIAVGPNQYPKVHRMAEHCAQTLGIGVPQVYVFNDPTNTMNAYTFALDDREPVVVLHSALVATMTDDELLSIIGHECGHIHNNHGIYNTMVELVVQPTLLAALGALPGAGTVLIALMHGYTLFLKAWSRAAEVTCDRAGLICCGSPDVSQAALARLKTGGSGVLKEINLKEYLKQGRIAGRSNLMRLSEALQDHPLIFKRIEAVRLFAESDVYLDWCPERAGEQPGRSLTEVDEQCAQFIRVFKSGYQMGAP